MFKFGGALVYLGEVICIIKILHAGGVARYYAGEGCGADATAPVVWFSPLCIQTKLCNYLSHAGSEGFVPCPPQFLS